MIFLDDLCHIIMYITYNDGLVRDYMLFYEANFKLAIFINKTLNYKILFKKILPIFFFVSKMMEKLIN